MIHGIGCDIVQINRLKEKQNEFANKILTKCERELYDTYTQKRQLEFLAGRFAAKEAIFKAMHNPSLTLSMIEILHDELGCPICNIEGYQIHISISHEKEYAIAYAICEMQGSNL